MKFTCATIAVLLLLSGCHATRTVKSQCDSDSRFVIESAAEHNRDDLEPTFERFRNFLGGANNGSLEGPQEGGHRQINWDADIVPFDMPGDFFHIKVTRGLELIPQKKAKSKSKAGTRGGRKNGEQKFLVSNAGDDDKFDSINPGAAQDFSFFSENRLFTHTKDNKLTIIFHEAGSGKHAPRAGVKGFGAVFVDVDKANKTKMVWKNKRGCVITEAYVEPKDEGLSFLGMYLDDSDIFSVEIHLPTTIDKLGTDFVVMDDFIYGEPTL